MVLVFVILFYRTVIDQWDPAFSAVTRVAAEQPGFQIPVGDSSL